MNLIQTKVKHIELCARKKLSGNFYERILRIKINNLFNLYDLS